MRILQVTNGFPPTATAGVEQYTYQLSRGLSSRHKVLVFCRESDFGRADYEVLDDAYDGLPVRRVVNDFKQAFDVQDFYLDRRVESIFRDVVAEWQPTIVHFQHCIGLSASLLKLAAQMRIPRLLTLHDYWFICSQVQLLHRRGHICPGPISDPDCYDCRLSPNGVLAPIRGTRLYTFLRRQLSEESKRRMLRLLSLVTPTVSPPSSGAALSPFKERDEYMLSSLKTVPLILTPSSFLKDVYVEHGVPEERIAPLPLGLDLHLWQIATGDFRAPSEGLQVGYFGTLLRHKGIHVLIKAFRQLEDPKAALHIYGFPVPGDPYIDELQMLAGRDPRVQLLGRYQQQDLPSLFNAIDVMVIPSLWHETFSIVAREAILSGTPVVASQVGALPEVVRHGENGLLVPSGDIDALGSALISLSTDPTLLPRLRAGVMRSAEFVKNMDDHVHEIEQIYESLLASEQSTSHTDG
jgi:glycosyltransferase involved in cell wall biosynthesis